MRTALRFGTFLGTAAALCAAAQMSACGQPDIDRTMPNKVEKSIFKKEDGTAKQFFYRQTVIDVPATNGISFIGEQSETERIVFDITEGYLYAYRELPHVAANDGTGDDYVRPGASPFFGAPVAAFVIQSHFDVKRQYNPSTGEQTNIVYEDGSDRPWYERDYIRVDWSTNHVADYRFGVSAVTQQPLADVVPQEDDSHDDSKERAIVRSDYIDVVTRFTAEPEHMYFDGYGNLPICYFYQYAQKDCLGGVVSVRSSFREVGESDYMPQSYDDLRFQKFGFFRTERVRHNDQYGQTEPDQIRLANRWNLWTNAQGCYDADLDLPYSQCEPENLRTIVYYLNEDFPQTQGMVETAKHNADKWNELWRKAVLDMTGWSEADLGDRRIYTLCTNNPVQDGDPAECGTPGTNPQMGDLRYSMYYYVPNVQDSSPLGYGPSATDPLTGEIIQANAFYYGAPGGWIAARTRDIVKLELGLFEGGVDDIRDGLPQREAIQNLRARSEERMLRQTNVDSTKIREMAQNLQVAQKGMRLRHQIETGEAFLDRRDGRLQALDSQTIDEDLMTDEIKDALAVVSTAQDGTEMLTQPDSLKLLVDPRFMSAINKIRDERLLSPKAGGCILMAEDVFDDGLLGLVGIVKSKFYDTSASPPVLKDGFTDEDVYAFIEARTMGDTQLHEIGHTVGLRHNFSGTADALNYDPSFWELRKLSMSASDERPRAEWALGGASLTAHISALNDGLRDAQNSTVMDYASTYGTNLELGSYDLAAIKFAYGDVVEVFNSPDINADRADLLKAGELHYAYYPEVVSDASTYDDRVAAIYDRRSVNYRKTAKGDSMFDGSLVEAPYYFCSDEYNHASATCATWDQGADNYERTLKAAEDYRSYYVFDAFKRERVTFGINVFDYLNRVYSRKFTPMLNQYKNWVNDELIIRSDRPCKWIENGQLQESADRFAADQCGLAGFLGTVELMNLFSEVIQTPDVGCYVRLQPGCYDTVASNENGISSADTFQISTDPASPDCDAHVPVQPAADSRDPSRKVLKITATSSLIHVADATTCDGFQPIEDTVTGDVISSNPVELGVGGARPANTTYDRTRYGYYFYLKPIVIGSWWEKWLAVKALGDGDTDFVGVDASSDTRSYLISLNLLFGDAINDLVGGVVGESAASYAGRINSEGTDVEFLPLLDTSTGGVYDRSGNTRAYIDPDQQYTFRLLAMFNAAYQGQYTDDLEFGESLRVGSAYNNTDVSVPDTVRADPLRYSELTDTVTGLKWYALNQTRDVYSIGYEFIRQTKNKYYVGGADGPGTTLRPEFSGDNDFLPRSDIRTLNIMQSTSQAFGYSSVWEGDIQF